MRIYVIYDKVAVGVGFPFAAKNDGVALRLFRQGIKDVPEIDRDAYELRCIGAYDEKDGDIFDTTNTIVVMEEEEDSNAGLI